MHDACCMLFELWLPHPVQLKDLVLQLQFFSQSSLCHCGVSGSVHDARIFKDGPVYRDFQRTPRPLRGKSTWIQLTVDVIISS